jgi:hypothetical protein
MNILDSDNWIFLVPVDGNGNGNKNNIKTKNESLKIEQPQKNLENLENQDNSKEEITQNSIINQNDTVKKILILIFIYLYMRKKSEKKNFLVIAPFFSVKKG